MLRRVTFLFFCVATLGCNDFNEPYILFPLGVTTFRDAGAGTTSSHVYKDGMIQSFTETSGNDTLTNLEFFYNSNRLTSIVKDSSTAGYELVLISGYGSAVTIDSTFSIAGEVTTLKEVRKQLYDVNQLLERIELTQWNGSIAVRSAYELDWTGNNVSEIRAIGINEGAEAVQHTVVISYDDRMGVFSSNIPYVYTLLPEELYWLSANNPVRFKLDDHEETKYRYYYNLKNYPARILTNENEFLSFTYVELR